jgi:hypothetical protein
MGVLTFRMSIVAFRGLEAWPICGLFEWPDNRYISYTLANRPKEPLKED